MLFDDEEVRRAEVGRLTTHYPTIFSMIELCHTSQFFYMTSIACFVMIFGYIYITRHLE